MKFDNYKKKTYTNYWNNFSKKPKNRFYNFNYLKKFKKFLFKLIGFKLSIRLIKYKTNEDDAYHSYPTNNTIKNYRNNIIVKEVISFLETSNLKINRTKIELYVKEF